MDQTWTINYLPEDGRLTGKLHVRDDEVAFEEPLVSDEFADAGRFADAFDGRVVCPLAKREELVDADPVVLAEHAVVRRLDLVVGGTRRGDCVVGEQCGGERDDLAAPSDAAVLVRQVQALCEFVVAQTRW